MPAPRAIMAAAVEGAQVDIDTALDHRGALLHRAGHRPGREEHDPGVLLRPAGASTPAARVRRHREARDQEGRRPRRRHDGRGHRLRLAPRPAIEVVLKDVSLEAAEQGQGATPRSIEAKALSRGKTTQEKSDALLGRITPTADAADFEGVDFVIEAVFESAELKHKVFQEIEDIVDADALLGSNTSTLPITGLAEGVKRSGGLHRHPLLLARRQDAAGGDHHAARRPPTRRWPRSFDYALQITKTPIVVNDSRGFFTSRVIGTFINEAIAMVGEGIEPGHHRAGRSAGRLPGGAAAAQRRAEPHADAEDPQGDRRGRVEAEGERNCPRSAAARGHRHAGRRVRPQGQARAARASTSTSTASATGLWPGLRETFSSATSSRCPFQDLKERMLFAEAIETAEVLRRRRAHAPPPTPTSARSSASASRPGRVARTSSSSATPVARRPSSPAPTSWPRSSARVSRSRPRCASKSVVPVSAGSGRPSPR